MQNDGKMKTSWMILRKSNRGKKQDLRARKRGRPLNQKGMHVRGSRNETRIGKTMGMKEASLKRRGGHWRQQSGGWNTGGELIILLRKTWGKGKKEHRRRPFGGFR